MHTAPSHTPMSRVQELLTQLVQCPSVSPPDGIPAAPPYGEAALAQILAAFLNAIGADVTLTEFAPGRPNLVAQIAGSDPSRTLLLDAHADTVSHANMTIDPFGAHVQNGRLYGRGACDTKGPMAAMLLALEQVMATGGPSCNVIFAATCDEEAGGGGARLLVESDIQADFAVIAEPTQLRLVNKHKGVLRASITMEGKAAHSSSPQLGHNAIYPMAHLIGEIESAAKELAAGTPDPDLGTPTLAATMLSGGLAENIIPPNCDVTVDRRTLPSEKAGNVKRALESLVEEATASTPWASPRVTWMQEYPPLFTPQDHIGIIQMTAALEAMGLPVAFTAAPYATNGGFYAQVGIPSVVFGPGDIADAHTKDESIELEQVVIATEVLAHVLSR